MQLSVSEKLSDSFQIVSEISISSGEQFFENFDTLTNIDKINSENYLSVYFQQQTEISGNDTRSTLPFLTKYEKARILGARALQISMGAPLCIEIEGETDPLDIASKELLKRKIPILIRRYLPNGSYEDWNLDELIIE